MPIFFPGAEGSYAHAVCVENFSGEELISCSSVEYTLKSFSEDKDRNSYLILPIENSIGGKVSDIHSLIPDFARYFICNEFYKIIDHCLIGKKDSEFSKIKKVLSHIQALKQCSRFIEIHKLDTIEATNTALAAKSLSESSNNECAAIASREAAETYGLTVLKEKIQNSVDINLTRFFCIRKRSNDFVQFEPEKKYLTCVYYTVKNIRASLFKSLIGFSTYSINIVKLESFIKTPEARLATFYIELEGHAHEESVRLSLEELKYFSSDVEIIGLFERNF